MISIKRSVRLEIAKISTENFLLNSAGTGLYILVNYLVILLFRVRGLTIYPRNSYFFKRIVPGLSDIDYSLIVKSDDEMIRGISLYHSLRRVFKLLGEVNIIDDFVIQNISLMNVYEAGRDPLLKKLRVRDGRIEERSVFLTRMMRADVYLGGYYQKIRRGKWASHLKETVGDCECLGSDVEVLLEKVRAQIIVLPENEQEFSYDTVTWMANALHHGLLEKELQKVNNFSDQSHRIAYSQIIWELFGCWQQRHTIPHEQMVLHFKNMQLVLEILRVMPHEKVAAKKMLEMALSLLEDKK